jgi:16S rRNA (guanine966-N2)-methyltransferase
MRIISGKFKGKKLHQPLDNLTRPLRDMVKEAIFNFLAHSEHIKINMKEACILDLFSGSGSFGIECISREAKKVVFCENYEPALRVLKKNIKSLNEVKKIEINTQDIYEMLDSQNFKNRFNLIFLDPPFKEQKVNELLSLINKSDILEKDGLIILHRNKKSKDTLNMKYDILLEKIYGISKIYFIKF